MNKDPFMATLSYCFVVDIPVLKQLHFICKNAYSGYEGGKRKKSQV